MIAPFAAWCRAGPFEDDHALDVFRLMSAPIVKSTPRLLKEVRSAVSSTQKASVVLSRRSAAGC
jgi:hypothetical protein